jgi:hypothetical protein
MKPPIHGFSGSYKPEDCIFLLNQLPLPEGTNFPGWEKEPDALYMALYHEALEQNAKRLAEDVAKLALSIAANKEELPVLLSLARAGTPYGALLVRALRLLGRNSVHYGVSLIKGYGVDHQALDYVRKQHPEGTIHFIDGWTGKGGISRELRRSVRLYNEQQGTNISENLQVIADLAGTAGTAVSTDDYFIPSAPINAPMNGLISKTFGESEKTLPTGFHGTYLLEHLATVDYSNHFLNRISGLLGAAFITCSPKLVSPQDQAKAHLTNETSMLRLKSMLNIDDEDLIKHGYCETARAMQRRPMQSLRLRNSKSKANQALIALARVQEIAIIEDPHLHYECVGICRQ